MGKDNYRTTKDRYEIVGEYAVSRATGARLSRDESRSVKHLEDWRRNLKNGKHHDWSYHDCGIEKQAFGLWCTGHPEHEIKAGEEHIHAVEYDSSDDVLVGRGRIKSDDYICAQCWEADTGKLISRQRFGRVGPKVKRPL